jgi:hypothetical protein
MRHLAIAALLAAVLLSAGPAVAASAAPDFRSVLRTMGGSITIPAEWEGVWTTTDTTYNCQGVRTGTSSSENTLCAGQSAYDPPTGEVIFSCDGTATATEVHMTCSGAADVMPDCRVTVAIRIDVTRTDDAYFSVMTMQTSYAGTATGCDLLPATCEQRNSHGMRVGAPPVGYCGTPTLPSSWGKIKAHYR